MDTSTPKPFRRGLFWIYFSAFLIGIAWSYVPQKLIWIDEYLHFVLGAESSLTDAWKAFLRGGIVNHGQTGVFFMGNYLSLKFLDASFFSLRLPSLIFSVLLGLSFALCLVVWRVHFALGLMAIVAFFSHIDLIGFISEARVYILLMATAVGVTAFFSVPLEERKQLCWQVFGGSILLLGFMGHPYFIAYFGIAIVVGAVRLQLRWNQIWAHCAPLLSGVAIASGLLLASFTWFRFLGHKFGFFPYEYFKDGRSFFRVLVSWHIGGLGPIRYAVIALTLGLIGWATFKFLREKSRATSTAFAPALLLIGALVASLLVSWASFRSEYWILSRQWVASGTLFVLGTAWMIQKGVDELAHWRLSKWIPLAVLLAVIPGLFKSVPHQNLIKNNAVSELNALIQKKPELLKTYGNPPSIYPGQTDSVALANLNCIEGGPVWKLFKEAYRVARGSE